MSVTIDTGAPLVTTRTAAVQSSYRVPDDPGTFTVSANRLVVVAISKAANGGDRTYPNSVTIIDGTNGNLQLTLAEYTRPASAWDIEASIWYGWTSVSRTSVYITIDYGTSNNQEGHCSAVFSLSGTKSSNILGSTTYSSSVATNTAKAHNITPSASGSIVIGAFGDSDSGTAPTDLSGTTTQWWQSSWRYAWFCSYLTSGTSQVTVGSSAPTTGTRWTGCLTEFLEESSVPSFYINKWKIGGSQPGGYYDFFEGSADTALYDHDTNWAGACNAPISDLELDGSGHVRTAANWDEESGARYTASTSATSQVVIKAQSTADDGNRGVILFANATNGYRIELDGNSSGNYVYLKVYWFTTGSTRGFGPGGGNTSYTGSRTVDHTLKATAVVNTGDVTITVWIDGVQIVVAQDTDSSRYTSGNPGIYIRSRASADNSLLDIWTDGNNRDPFTGSSGVSLATHDSNWGDVSTSYPVSRAELNGSGQVRWQTGGGWQYGGRYTTSNSDICQIIVKARGTAYDNERGVIIRCDGSGTFYEARINGLSGGNYGNVNLFRWNSGSATWIAAGSPTWSGSSSADHIVKVIASGTNPVNIKVYIDDSLYIDFDDSSGSRITSGNPGFIGSSQSYQDNTLFDDWQDY